MDQTGSMHRPPRRIDPEPEPARPAAQLRRLDAADLLAGAREVVLVHGDAEYRLHLTRNGKLILTK